MEVLRAIFEPAPAPIAGFDDWRRRHDETSRGLALPVDKAIVCGAAMDRVGWAFASGYQAALEALVPGVSGLVVLCATEEGGAHPSAIRTAIARDGAGLVLDGRKQWCTLGTHAEQLLIVAREGDGEDGRARLRLVRVPSAAPGVKLVPMPEAPFAPEVPHAVVELAGVRLAEDHVLPGDGYERYLKPFRTLEDVHVTAAILAHLARVAFAERLGEELEERLASAVVTFRGLAPLDPSAPETHLALSGALRESHDLLTQLDAAIPKAGPDAATRWRRDAPLFGIAGRVREARRKRARERLRPS